MKVAVVILLAFVHVHFVQSDIHDNKIEQCNLPQAVKDEIRSYKKVVDNLVEEIINGQFKGSTYNYLSEFIDTFGYRISGSKNLENAIDYMLELSKKKNLENVHGENVLVPHWVRGNESAVMVKPRFQNLPMLGLGSSVGTPPGGIEAEVVVVSSFKELNNIKSKVKGKIVVFNQKYVSYGVTVKYRDYAADRSSAYGAVATLIRSITPFSMNTPHTGWQDYSGNLTKIPTACITIEDANMLHRRYKRGEQIIIQLKMDAETLPPSMSRNTIVDIKGKEKPKDMVIISGHLDSWDTGEGAMDDGAAAIMSWNTLVILKALNLRSRRTLRAILWTGEEEGLVGAFAYAKKHKNEFNNLDFVMESDIGTFTPLGLEYIGTDYGACILQEVLQLLEKINTTQLTRSNDVGSDITIIEAYGVPGASLLNKNERYFWYHHSPADTMDLEDPDTLDKCTALWAAASYVIADLSFDFPRHTQYVNIKRHV